MALPKYTPARRHEMAAILGINEQYLYQLMRGLKPAAPLLARRINALDPSVSLKDLRPKDWWIIWPELIAQPAAKPESDIAAA